MWSVIRTQDLQSLLKPGLHGKDDMHSVDSKLNFPISCACQREETLALKKYKVCSVKYGSLNECQKWNYYPNWEVSVSIQALQNEYSWGRKRIFWIDYSS